MINKLLEFVRAVGRFRRTPIVDDDFETLRNEVDGELTRLEKLIEAYGQNPIRRPKVVCLCGSTKFLPLFQEINFRETMAGSIVLTVGDYWKVREERMIADGCMGHQEVMVHTVTPQKRTYSAGEKESLDALHLRKILLADEVIVINPGNYIGESTRNEIAFANQMGVPIRFYEPQAHAVVPDNAIIRGKIVGTHPFFTFHPQPYVLPGQQMKLDLNKMEWRVERASP